MTERWSECKGEEIRAKKYETQQRVCEGPYALAYIHEFKA